MKKIIALLTVLMLCAAMVVPASAANEFTPSVSNKPAPEIVPVVDPNGDPAIGEIINDIEEIIDYVYQPCIVVTPVSEANTSTEIPADAKDMLLDVYAKLQSGEMSIPSETLFGGDLDNDDMVIRDLFDVTFLCEEHPAMLEPAGIVFRITFDIGVEAGVDVYTTTYKNGEWVKAVSTVNNGDGTVTCLIEDFCPVAFSVEVEDDEPVEPPVQTGDQAGEQLFIWIAVAAVALVAVVALTVVYVRGMKKNGQ